MRIYYFGKLIADTSLQTEPVNIRELISKTPVGELLNEIGSIISNSSETAGA